VVGACACTKVPLQCEFATRSQQLAVQERHNPYVPAEADTCLPASAYLRAVLLLAALALACCIRCAVPAPQDFCSRKAAAAGSPEESETWTFMGVLFEDDARRQLLAKLGFSEAMVPQAAGTGAATGGGLALCLLCVLV
jgi:hypothetical protein